MFHLGWWVCKPQKDESTLFPRGLHARSTATITFADEVVSYALGVSGATMLALLQQSAGDGSKATYVCYCRRLQNPTRFTEALWWSDESCGVAGGNYGCRTCELPASWTRRLNKGGCGPSPTGRHFIAIGRRAEVAVLAKPQGLWSGPNLVAVSGPQSRQISPPFAFDHSERLMAVPIGDRGIRILGVADLQVRSELPTPSRIYSLDFLGSVIVSVDGANDDAILRVQPWQPREIVARALCVLAGRDTADASTGYASGEVSGRVLSAVSVSQRRDANTIPSLPRRRCRHDAQLRNQKTRCGFAMEQTRNTYARR